MRISSLFENIIHRNVGYSIQIPCFKMCLGTERGVYCIYPNNITKESVIYSFGVGNDISFDLSMIERFGVHVYAFDPSPNSINWIKTQNLPKEFHFFEFAIADHDGIAKFNPPRNPPRNPRHFSYTMLHRQNKALAPIEAKVFRMKTILNMLGHKKINILKMDIEGTEYAVIEDLISSEVELDQLLVEFHHRFEKIGVSKTKRVIELLNNQGFKIFDISPKGHEYSFLRM